MTGPAGPAIVWFRRDLRLADNPALEAAAAKGRSVLPVFVVDPAFARAGAPRRAFLRDCLVSLDASIRELNGRGLIVRTGDPTTTIVELAEEVGAGDVFVAREFAPYGRRRDAAVAAALVETGRRLHGVGSPYAVAPGTVRKADGGPYAVFTPFSRAWRRAGWPSPVPIERLGDVSWWSGAVRSDPPGPTPDPGSVALPPAGERAAHDRWEEFRRELLADYPGGRDEPARAATSRLSSALKFGTVHPRQLLVDLDASGDGDGADTKFSAELAWREFAADVLFHHPDSAWENLDRRMDLLAVDTDAAARRRFERWCSGTTGFGLVDAGMRELATTGWMHNRVRMVVASFLVKDLHLPWQWGARWFLRHLVDGDLASNSLGWQWAAGTGADAAPYFRVFNPLTQQQRYDPTGDYVARWVPQGVAPMLDHAVERDEALRRFRSLPRSVG